MKVDRAYSEIQKFSRHFFLRASENQEKIDRTESDNLHHLSITLNTRKNLLEKVTI